MKKIVAVASASAGLLLAAGGAHAADPGSISYLSQHTTLGVKIYADMSSITNSSDGTDVNPTGYGFDVKRGYLTLDTAFNDDWSMRFRTDFNYKSVISETNVYIKNLYAQRKLGNGMKLRIGVADMPWIPHMEDLYRFRYVENVMVDEYHFANSADWGLHLLGNENKINWQVSLVNGGGYKNPSRSKGMDLEGRLDYNAIGGLHLVFGGYTGKRGKDTQNTAANNTASRYDLAAVYEAKGWNAGVDYFSAKNWNTVTDPYTSKADGYSVFGSYNFTPVWAVFARYDHLKPCKDVTQATNPTCYSDTKNTYYNVGLQYIASKQIRIAFVYKYDKADNGFVSTANGSIGGVGSGKYQEFGIWMQAAF